MSGAMRFAVVFTLGVTALAACGANDLQPIHDPPRSDAAVEAPDEREAAPQDAAPMDAGLPRGDGGGSLCKRGIASNAGPSAAFAPSSTSQGISWWYNWAAASPGGDARIEFVPMLWGGGSLNESVPGGSRYLLGFNEPNFKTQANLTAAQAAADWPRVEAKAGGLPIVSPGVNFCGSASDTSQCSDPAVTDPYTYLKDFFAACRGCRVDYIAVHAYDCDLPALRAYLEGNTDAGGTLQGFGQFGKPIWLTEFSCDASRSIADQKAYMQAAVPYLEGQPDVFRYAWFSAKPIPNAELTNSDGTLTDLGMTYVALPARCR
jgi:hypothetical protein